MDKIVPMITEAGFPYTCDTISKLPEFEKFAQLVIEQYKKDHKLQFQIAATFGL